MLKIAAGVLCLLSLPGCRNAPKADDYFITLRVAEQLPLAADSFAPSCKIEISLLCTEGADATGCRINAGILEAAFQYRMLPSRIAIDSFKTHYLRRYVDELFPYYREDRKHSHDIPAWYNYTYTMTTSVQQGRKGIYNYTISIDSYEGGAHGYHTGTYLNFVASSGQLLTLDDVFVEGYKEPLAELLLHKLMEQTGASSIEALRQQGYLNWTEMYPSRNFLLKEKGVEFLYNPYEIAPYSNGTTVLEIPYRKLYGLLNL